jgi:short chain dehydrogenase
MTGASKGIGAALAKALAEAGAAAAVNYAADKEGAERTVLEITRGGGKAVAIQADVSKATDVKRLFEADGAVRHSVDSDPARVQGRSGRRSSSRCCAQADAHRHAPGPIVGGVRQCLDGELAEGDQRCKSNPIGSMFPVRDDGNSTRRYRHTSQRRRPHNCDRFNPGAWLPLS